ncbi:Hypothetical protein, putative [Bodo saltans]|uniref:Anoctamin transmembrane domain-containing protein n=1 Tax=Bodo saltans TaxID=75058 RepID=A0A0S4JC59_BODSA|nr:Hypothetical protein, putative [Bodo saltans]|eukprot:CUG86477.1 Hypothetical protein, putative [Bodo saltans]
MSYNYQPNYSAYGAPQQPTYGAPSPAFYAPQQAQGGYSAPPPYVPPAVYAPNYQPPQYQPAPPPPVQMSHPNSSVPVQVDHFQAAQQPVFQSRGPALTSPLPPQASLGLCGSTAPLLATTTHHPLSFVGEAMQRAFNVPEKSLVFCLTMDNPFHLTEGDHRVVRESSLDGAWETLQDSSRRKLPFPFLGDDEFLMKPPPKAAEDLTTGTPFSAFAPHLEQIQQGMSSLSQSFMALSPTTRGNGTAPNKFQKVIEIILRLYNRGVDLYPNNMIAPVLDCVTAEQTNQNYFHKYTLVEDALLLSPDQDEMYIRLYVRREVMLGFAEAQGVLLPTNPYSFSGGAPISYSKAMDAKLKHSVQMFMAAFPDDCKPDVDDVQDGFVIDVPDKMRLVTRMMRESWQFGGCGLQIDEMKRGNVLIRHFFPLHNIHYQKAYHLDEWSKLTAMFSLDPLKQDDNSIRKYFGEEVALYFGWLVTYTRFLRYIAAAGLVFGIIAAVAGASDVVNDDVAPISNAIFSVFCVVWGITWNFRSIRFENLFATRFGQEAQITQELVRDEFQKDSEKIVTVEELFRLKFDVPLTLKVRADGTLVDLQYSNTKRLLWRYLVAYPVIVVLTSGMIALQLLITNWRLSDCATSTSTLCSISSVAVSVIFGFGFDYLVPILNGLENNRTDTEEAFQTISKSFFFYFFSNFFAIFSIALYPSNTSFVCFNNNEYRIFNGTWYPTLPADAPAIGSTDGPDRLDEIMYQMLFTTVVKPFVQNILELLMPFMKAKWRVYQDTQKSKGVYHKPRPLQEEANALWKESQLEPYESTSGDYLEITLQFGFMTMFAAAFPLATVAALLYNILEIRLDALKLVEFSQRPVARPAVGIGAWRGIQFFISAMSVVSNGYMVAVLSNFSNKTQLGSDSAAKYKIFVLAQYIVMMLFYVVYTTYSGPSPKSEKYRVKHALVSNQASREKLLEEMSALQRDKSGSGGSAVMLLLQEDQEMAGLISNVLNSPTVSTPPPAPGGGAQAAVMERCDSPHDEDIL